MFVPSETESYQMVTRLLYDLAICHCTPVLSPLPSSSDCSLAAHVQSVWLGEGTEREEGGQTVPLVSKFPLEIIDPQFHRPHQVLHMTSCLPVDWVTHWRKNL